MNDLNASTDELVAELARRLRTPEPVMRTRVGLPTFTSARPGPRYAEDGWSWSGNDS